MRVVLVVILAAWAVVATWFALAPRGGREAPAAPAPAVEAEAASASRPQAGGADQELRDLRLEVAQLRADLTAARKSAAAATAAVRRVATAVPATGKTVPLELGSNVAESVSRAVAQALSGGRLSNLVGQALAGLGGPPLRDRYEPLFARLGLDEAKKKAFLDHMGSRLVVRAAGGDGLPEDPALQELLGDAGYREWQAYEKTLPGRLAAQDVGRRLDTAGRPLSEAQQQRLSDLFSRHGFDDGSGGEAIEFSMDAGQPVDRQIDHAVNRGLERWDQMVEEARGVLDNGQMKEFDAYMGERLDRREKMANMAASIATNIHIQTSGAGAGAVPVQMKIISAQTMNIVDDTEAAPAEAPR